MKQVLLAVFSVLFVSSLCYADYEDEVCKILIVNQLQSGVLISIKDIRLDDIVNSYKSSQGERKELLLAPGLYQVSVYSAGDVCLWSKQYETSKTSTSTSHSDNYDLQIFVQNENPISTRTQNYYPQYPPRHYSPRYYSSRYDYYDPTLYRPQPPVIFFWSSASVRLGGNAPHRHYHHHY